MVSGREPPVTRIWSSIPSPRRLRETVNNEDVSNRCLVNLPVVVDRLSYVVYGGFGRKLGTVWPSESSDFRTHSPPPLSAPSLSGSTTSVRLSGRRPTSLRGTPLTLSETSFVFVSSFIFYYCSLFILYFSFYFFPYHWLDLVLFMQEFQNFLRVGWSTLSIFCVKSEDWRKFLPRFFPSNVTHLFYRR